MLVSPRRARTLARGWIKAFEVPCSVSGLFIVFCDMYGSEDTLLQLRKSLRKPRIAAALDLEDSRLHCMKN